MEDTALGRLARHLDHDFADQGLLEQAVTHSSAARGPGGRVDTNERLEFLGDRVLGLIVADMLYTRFPQEEEGALARRHAALVQRDTLARVAEGSGIPDALIVSRGEEDTGGRANPGILSDCCEAVIAALYLDGGLDAARAFVSRAWAPLVEEDPTPPKDPKTALQEWAQGRGLPLPSYRQVSKDGPAHAPTFVVEASLPGHGPQQASGGSKRTAERAAAEALLAAVEGKGAANG